MAQAARPVWPGCRNKYLIKRYRFLKEESNGKEQI
jgi:hypothetical protein